MARTPLLFLALAASIIIFASSGAAVLQCGENLAGATTILKLSAQTNAHGEIYSQTNYATNINCRETTGVSVGPTQPNLVTLLKLSAPTNAHAEASTGTNYATLVQMGDNHATGQILTALADSTAPTNNSCNDFDSPNATFVEVVRMNSLTNAHLQSPSYAGTKYRYIVCAAYDSSGGAPAPENIAAMLAANNTGAFPIPAGGSGIVDLTIQNQVFSDSAYNNLAVLQVTFICDTADTTTSGVTGETCASMTDYGDARTETNAYLTGATNTIMRIPSTIEVKYYKAGGDTSAWDTLYTNYTGTKQILPTIDGVQNTLHQYTIDTSTTGMNLAAGNYKLITVLTPVEYDRTGMLNDNLEAVAFFNDNVDDFVFSVLPGNCGNGIVEPLLLEVCDPPGAQGVCSNGYTCNSTCTQCIIGGGGTPGLAGDVYVLKDISFPNVYTNGNITAELTIENKDIALTGSDPTTDISIIVRDAKGVAVAGFSPAVFARQINGSSDVESIVIQTPNAPFLREGETYTLYATVKPYDDITPSLDEKITTNNSGFKTFTAIDAPQTYAVPDAPWWMSIALVFVVSALLIVFGRKKE